MKIPRLFLPEQEREILKICDDLNTYWKTNDNFEVALERYLEDLTFKFNLGLTQGNIHEIVNEIFLKLFGDFEISYANAIYVFAQFIIIFIFKGLSPRHLLINTDEILNIVINIENYLIPAETRLGGFKVVLRNRL
jgi:hypothetical protein